MLVVLYLLILVLLLHAHAHVGLGDAAAGHPAAECLMVLEQLLLQLVTLAHVIDERLAIIHERLIVTCDLESFLGKCDPVGRVGRRLGAGHATLTHDPAP